ncbi:hypothetical protein [Hazenella coriacea]|uniref:Uncharacterized protein n=1 Tax=Hazenella coriacea TaxID=1179467 RepID=A0A4R3L1A7_9BACL|nr:hypothetical protein [Hazenella coriacea]TCS93139.1 hypothetical protein EDD58_10981 [Hazenella coriacea]
MLHLTLEEMNMLSEQLEKEKARLHQQYSQQPIEQSNADQQLHIVSQLQKKLKDLKANVTEEEKEMLTCLLQDEIEQIHGHSPGVYESILNKLNQ